MVRGRCRNLRCTKPWAAIVAYGYLINLAATALRASKGRTDSVSLGVTAARAFCKLRELFVGDFVGSKPQHGTAQAACGRGRGGGIACCLWVEGGGTGSSSLPTIALADVRRARERTIENFDDDHAASATRTWRQLVVGAGWSIVIIIAMGGR